MLYLIFQREPNGELTLIDQPAVDDEDCPVMSVILPEPLPLAA